MRLVVVAVLLCGCPAKQATGPTGGSQGSAPPPVKVTDARTCDDVKPRVEQLYRAEAAHKEPKRIEEAVADNTAMVMTDCAKDPATFVPCLATVGSVAELEQQCIVPLDDEGSEGDALAK